jgi:predicted TIM-barrel fold metal-dependent hydrolase
MIINVHAHIRPGDDVRQRVEYFRAPDIEKICLSGDNVGVLAACKAEPDFVIPIADLAIDAAKPAALTDFNSQGFRGVRFEVPAAPYDDERYFPLYDRLQDLCLPVFLQTGHIRGDVKCRTEFMHPICLDTIARYFPELVIIGSQLGNPWFFEAISAMMYNKNVYFDLSGGVARGLPMSLFKIIFGFRDVYLLRGGIGHRLHDESVNHDIFRKLVFGTGSPQPEIIIAFYRDLFEGLQIDMTTRALVFWGNAASIFNITDV